MYQLFQQNEAVQLLEKLTDIKFKSRLNLFCVSQGESFLFTSHSLSFDDKKYILLISIIQITLCKSHNSYLIMREVLL